MNLVFTLMLYLVILKTIYHLRNQRRTLHFVLHLNRKRVQPEKTPRLLRSFAQSRVLAEKGRGDQPLIPGMSGHSNDINVDAGEASSGSRHGVCCF